MTKLEMHWVAAKFDNFRLRIRERIVMTSSELLDHTRGRKLHEKNYDMYVKHGYMEMI